MRELKDISPLLSERIRAFMPMFGSPLNPVDISGTASPKQYKGAITQAICDPSVSAVYGSICPTAVTDVDAVTDIYIDIYNQYKHLGKPLVMECQGGEECGTEPSCASGMPESPPIRQPNRQSMQSSL